MKAKRKAENRKAAQLTAFPKTAKTASQDDDGAPRSAMQLAALKRLGITQQQLATAPRIEPLLRQASGGLKQVIAAMRFAPDAAISAFLRRYDGTPANDRKTLPFEAIALAAGVDITALLGSIMLSLQSMAVNSVKLIALSGHPQITRARIKYGQLPGGSRDREALDTAMGFLPNPRGATFIGKAVFGSGDTVMQQQRRLPGKRGPDEEDQEEEREVPIAANPDDYDLDGMFPPPAIMQDKLNTIRNRTLPADTSPDPAKFKFKN